MNGWLFVADVALLWFGARRIAMRVAARDGSSVCAAYAMVIGFSFAITSLEVLAAIRQFHPWAVTGTFAAFALVAHRFAAAQISTANAESAVRMRTWHLPLVVPVAAFLPHLVRSMASPPRAWDALTYHLPRAANWLNDAGFLPHVAPDAGRYYEFFPPGGDLLFAFTFLAGSGDALLFLVYGTTMAAILLATYVLARALDAPALDASIAVALVGTMPCVVHFGASAYVDGLTTALFLFALAFAAHASRDATPSRFVVASLLAAGATAATKSTGLPLLGLCVVLGILHVHAGRIQLSTLALATLAAVLPTLVFAGYVAHHTGSPTYPFALRFFGIELTAGNELLRRTLDGSSGFGAGSHVTLARFVARLFVGSSIRGWSHLNLGLGSAIALGGCVPTLFGSKNSPARVRFVLVVAASIPLASVLSPSVVTLRTIWSPFSGRFLAPTVAIAACLLAARGTRSSRLALGLALLAAIPTLAPVGVVARDFVLGAPAIAIAAGWCIVLASPLALRARPTMARVMLVALSAATPLVFTRLETARALVRYDFYRAFARGDSYELHRVPIGSQADLWQFLDGPRHERIAFTTGYVAPGHNWCRYPLYGSLLQNQVLYVPATRSGVVEDTALPPPNPSPLDVDLYADRLVRERVTAVALVAPAAPEARLALRAGRRFTTRFASRAHDFVVLRPLPRER